MLDRTHRLQSVFEALRLNSVLSYWPNPLINRIESITQHLKIRVLGDASNAFQRLAVTAV